MARREHTGSEEERAFRRGNTCTANPVARQQTGFCPPLELDREIRGNANRLRELTDAFHAKHRSTLEDLKKANDACQDKYNQLDRNAKVHPRWQEMLPLALVAIPEMAFNYDAFRKLLAHYAIDSGLAASGIVAVIAATMAFAGHHVGLFLRHYNYSFRGGDIARKGDAIRPLGLGLFLLLLSVGLGWRNWRVISPFCRRSSARS